MWTCPDCARRFANENQSHSCIELSLDAALATASDDARVLYRAVEDAVADCGPFRTHPQRTRIAFITIMTFAGVRLARRWVDVSLITADAIDDARVRRIECYGPTTFANTIRLDEPAKLDAAVRGWLCQAWRRGNQETLDPRANARPLPGSVLGRVVVPLRARVVGRGDDLVIEIARYAAEILAGQPRVQARIGGTDVVGRIERAGERWRFCARQASLRDLGLAAGDAVDVSLRAAT